MLCKNSFSQYLVPEYIQNIDSDQPVVYATDIGGGFMAVVDLATRNTIPEGKRETGMLVSYQESGNWIIQVYIGANTLDANWTNMDNWITVPNIHIKVDSSANADTAKYSEKADTCNIALNAMPDSMLVNATNTMILDRDTLFADSINAKYKTINATAIGINGTYATRVTSSPEFDTTTTDILYLNDAQYEIDPGFSADSSILIVDNTGKVKGGFDADLLYWDFLNSNLGFGGSQFESAGTYPIQNTSIGGGMNYLTIGDENTSLGYLALRYVTIGSNNTGIGGRTLEDLTEGDNNTVVGSVTAPNITTGDNNTIIGTASLFALTTGLGNTVIGESVASNQGQAPLRYFTYNTIIGKDSFTYADSCNYNTSIGFSNMNYQRKSLYNIAIGQQALSGDVSEVDSLTEYNIAIGQLSLTKNHGKNNIGLGNFAGYGSVGPNYLKNRILIGDSAGYYDNNSNRLHITMLNAANPLIYGEFDNRYVKVNGVFEAERVIARSYQAFAYEDPDSVITTPLTTSWTFLGSGNNNKFTNPIGDGFSFDVDTLMFNQDVNDTRDSVLFTINYGGQSATNTVNKTVYNGIFIKGALDSDYTEYRACTKTARTTTADVYYTGPNCGPTPIWLKDGDKIQIRARCAVTTTTLSTINFSVYLCERK